MVAAEVLIELLLFGPVLRLHTHSLTNHMSKEMKCSDWSGLELGNGDTVNQNTWTKNG